MIEPDRTSSPTCLSIGIGFAGEKGFVDLEAVGDPEAAVGDDLIAGPEPEDVAEHDLLDGDLEIVAVADDPGPGDVEHGQPVEGALGPDLLDDADQGVPHHDQAEEGVLPCPGEQHHRGQRRRAGR